MHLGILLDEKHNFREHIDTTNLNVNKSISVMRPQMFYGDISYDQPQNESSCEKIESLQYRAALAITGAIQGTFRERIYQDWDQDHSNHGDGIDDSVACLK